MGFTLGGIFSAVAVMAVALIVQLARPAHADAPPPAETAAVVPAPAAPAPVVTELPVQTKVVTQAPAHVVRHLKSQKKTKVVASGRMKSNAILARHDSRDKRKQKADLDRLLGL
jgi:hypothetical protein